MKKYRFLIIAVLLLISCSGCSNIYDYGYDRLLDSSLNQKVVKKNTFLKGYKLYLPEHMTLIGDLDSNVILYSYGDKYYLYVDLVSYYNKKENKYTILYDNYIYSKEFNYDGKSGYAIVSESKGGYLVEIMYNYAKIEVVTKDVKRALTNGIIVLKNIKYNYRIIDSMIGSNTLVYDSEQFSLLGPNSSKKDNFLTYEEEYGTYDEDKEKQKGEEFTNVKDNLE